jgi:glutaredoxin
MKPTLILYTRKDCCLCEEMKAVVRPVAESFRFTLEEVDVDNSAELQERYGDEVPVLLVNGRKAFKYRATAKELENRLRKEDQGS